jgi:hypothetical protein
MMFEVMETHDHVGQPPRLAIRIATEKPYSCLLTLSFHVQLTAGHVTVNDFTVPSGGDCADMIGPAVGAQDLDLPAGRYALAVSHRDTTDTYRLDITDTSIAVAGSGFVSWPSEFRAWRYPPNSFAVACGATDDASWICDDARRMLLLEPGITPVSMPRTGRNPYGTAGNAHWYNESPHVYRYALRADYDRVVADITAFHDRVIGRQAGTTITVTTWLGERWWTATP